MTVEKIGLWHDPQHRYYFRYADKHGGPIPGVTGTIGMIDKPAIAIWRGNTVAEFIADNLPLFTEMLEKGGRDAAVKYAASLPNYQRDKAADVGSLVHILVEKILRRKQDVEIPTDLQPYAIAFMDWHRATKPKVISVERAVCNLTEGFAGTFDIFAEIDGAKLLIDAKTWRKLPTPGGDMYAETAMQLAAYGRGEFTGIPGDPKRYAAPRPDTYAVLHLRPDLYQKGWQLYPFNVTDADYAGFLGLLAAYRWKQDRAKKVIGEPHIVVPKELVA